MELPLRVQKQRTRLVPRALHGIALVEVIIFMVVIAVAAGAMLSVFAKTNRGSAELLVTRQAMAVAEAMLNEVLAAPFTICDPPGLCPGAAEVLPGGPEPGETRLGPGPLFDNVNDYNGFLMGPGITDRAGFIVPGLDAFSLTITVAPTVIAGTAIPAAQMALVTVTVTGPLLQAPVVLQGMRSRFAPTTAPL